MNAEPDEPDLDAPDAIESTIKAAWDRQDFDGAISTALEVYGDELFGFLMGLARDQTQAEDAFSAACERMWRGLPTFRWESSLRVWAYRISRNEFLRTTRDVARARKGVPISQVASVQKAIDRARTTTPPHERTEVKDRFAELRAELEPEDLMLLGLRIERKMAWADIAKVLADAEARDTPPDTREIATLRKRFARLKDKLRERARNAR
ncbi:MAG: RNA polymerase sigma factor [Kofleriaceae bacterium]